MGGKVITALVTLLVVLPIIGTGCPKPTDTTIKTAAQSTNADTYPTMTASYDFDDSGRWVEP
jgi:hypothetical protein